MTVRRYKKQAPLGSGLRIYGIHAVTAVVRMRPQDVAEVHVAPDLDNPRLARLRDEIASAGLPLIQSTRHELNRLSDNGTHQGAVARVARPPQPSESRLEELVAHVARPLLLVLEDIQDPQNLGACLRVASASGCAAVVAPRRNAVRLTATVWKASSGAVEYVELIRVASLPKSLRMLRSAGLATVGFDATATGTLYDADLSGPTALVIGGEGAGLGPAVRSECSELLAIPMTGELASLNLSVAAGVGLFEAVRQRGP